MKSLIYYGLMGLLILSGCRTLGKDRHMDGKIENMEIGEAIETVKDAGQKEMLSRYKANHADDSYITVSEHDNNFEIIISHPSFLNTIGERYTGGAEQVFLDKKTGRTKMGWHEHPMRIPEAKIKPMEVDKAD